MFSRAIEAQGGRENGAWSFRFSGNDTVSERGILSIWDCQKKAALIVDLSDDPLQPSAITIPAAQFSSPFRAPYGSMIPLTALKIGAPISLSLSLSHTAFDPI